MSAAVFMLGEQVTYRSRWGHLRWAHTVVSVNADGTYDVELAPGLRGGIPDHDWVSRNVPGCELGKVRVIRR